MLAVLINVAIIFYKIGLFEESYSYFENCDKRIKGKIKKNCNLKILFKKKKNLNFKNKKKEGISGNNLKY
jgi:hypothetical protein